MGKRMAMAKEGGARIGRGKKSRDRVGKSTTIPGGHADPEYTWRESRSFDEPS